MTSVEIRQLGKVYPDGHRAVAGVDLTIEDGELFVLVGPSGCGKTSVLRMVAGLEELTEGDIFVDGTSVRKLSTNDRDLAMLFQNSLLYPNMSVRSNIGFPLKLAGVPGREIDARVEQVAGMLGLSDALDERPHRLSGGQRQRVAMGRAMARRPTLLLMDEPMSNLDAKMRTELRVEIARMQRRLGVTTLYVTHDQVEAMSLGHRAGVMRAGALVQCGTPQELYESPRDVFVAQFVGTPPMNVLLAQLTIDDRGASLRIGSHDVALNGAEGRWPSLAAHDGRRVAVGIRPEALHLDPDGPLRAEITHLEHVGADQMVYATVDAHAVCQPGPDVVVDEAPFTTLVASVVGPAEVDIWKPNRFRVDVDRLHLFDLGTGLTIVTSDQADGAAGLRPVPR